MKNKFKLANFVTILYQLVLLTMNSYGSLTEPIPVNNLKKKIVHIQLSFILQYFMKHPDSIVISFIIIL